jgi:hypothetical protein
MGNYSQINREILWPTQRWTGAKEGNFIRPQNYRIPELCVGCPAAQDMDNPQISRVNKTREHEYMVRGQGWKGKRTEKELYSILVLNDEGKPSINPVYLGEVPFGGDPLSSQHEEGTSVLLGRVHKRVDECLGPQTKKKFLRDSIQTCGAGLLKLQAEQFDLRSLCDSVVVQSDRVAAENPMSEDDIKPEPSRKERSDLLIRMHLDVLRWDKVISEEEYQKRMEEAGLSTRASATSVEAE